MEKFIKNGNGIYKAIVFVALCAALILAAGFARNAVKRNKDSAVAAGASASAIVVEQSTRRELYGENTDARLPMASTTKILTALVVLENVDDLEILVEIPKAAAGVEGSSVYLLEGEKLSYRDLLYGLMLRSGNDCATALALAVGGSVENFAQMMNQTAVAAGAENSNFTNPHGLQDDNHFTTAKDLALITCRAMDTDVFKDIISAQSYRAEARVSGGQTRIFYNKNKMLKLYEGANGVKTGYTRQAGRCLVSSAERDGMQLVSVVLNHGAMWDDCARMMDAAFSTFKMRQLYSVTDQNYLLDVSGGQYGSVMAVAGQPIAYPLTDAEFNALDVRVNFDAPLRAPLKKGQIVGKICVYSGNRLIFESDFYTMQEIKRKGIIKTDSPVEKELE